ncbi:hypothetical protein ACFQJ5_03335 [Halomicroarcula sp. GCM10025324]|uniref:hypothetical protein n=1 Tax=Haloarcula TaxID=2237 RepID=UPI0023E7A9D5|nr:hypothetical protein [Halomicroarcula sp. ZS-22-S1]
MGLFDSIRNAVGGSDDGTDDDASTLLDSTTLDPTDFRQRADAVADADGLDFSPGSLADLEALVESLDDPETADDAAAATTYADPALRYGSYLGEVLVRAYDGTWTRDDGWGVTVAGPDDEVTVAVFEVAGRSLEGDPVFTAVVDHLEAELSLGDVAPGPEEQPDVEGSPSVNRERQPETAAPPDGEPLTDVDGAPSQGDDSAAETGVATPDADLADEPASDTAGESPTDLIGEAEPDAGPAPVPDADRDDSAAEPMESAASSDPVGEPARVGTETDDAQPTDDGPEPDTETPSDAKTNDPDPTEGDGIRAEYAETAQEFAAFWGEHDLDFGPGSLSRLDALVDAEWDADRFRDATFGADDDFDDRAFTSIATELGSYFGEVLCRELDAEWTDETDHVAAVVVATDDGPLAVPVFQVAVNSLRQSAVFERSYRALLEDIGRDGSDS